MKIKIVQVRNCKYAREDKSIIDCEAKFSGLPESVYDDTWLPFTANPNDSEKHGRDIFANAENGDYGEVADYEHLSLEYEISRIRADRNDLLIQTDWTRGDDVPQSTKDKFTTYRQELRDITEGIDTNAKARPCLLKPLKAPTIQPG